eukprot:scaffold11486_cov134-Skeletonema_menzelii.AAC.1
MQNGRACQIVLAEPTLHIYHLSNLSSTGALQAIRMLDVVLVAIPNRASSGQLCGCSAVATPKA